jgi:DNA-binding transcriptional LysR family regulator
MIGKTYRFSLYCSPKSISLLGHGISPARNQAFGGNSPDGGLGGSVLDKLEFLMALAREKHFGRAAETSGVTQPTLSAAIKQLEESLGVLLVNRGSRFQGFTPEGERVLEWARRIVGDTRAMRAEVQSLPKGLTGRLRIAVVPTALPMVAQITTPYRAKYPDVQFTIWSRTSIEILDLLENLEIDAGITYLDNEPVGRVSTVPLYQEQYRLLTAADAPLGDRNQVTWAEVAKVPLCLLTPDMQNRRIIDGLLKNASGEAQATLESDSMILLFSHVRTGRWASVMSAKIAETLGLTDTIRSIPIVEPEAVHTIGLVVPRRDPLTPLNAALVAEARRIAASFG